MAEQCNCIAEAPIFSSMSVRTCHSMRILRSRDDLRGGRGVGGKPYCSGVAFM